MIKHSPLFLIVDHNAIAACQTDQEQKEVPEENKGPKLVEFSDEDVAILYFSAFPHPDLFQVHNSVPDPETTTVYLSVLNPPPDHCII